MHSSLVIGTRSSALAMWQAQHVQGRLQSAHPGLRVELRSIKTQGDKILDTPLAKIGGKGLFVKELEVQLLEGNTDLAVHSMKDIPVYLPEDLRIAAITEREDPRDALVSRDNQRLEELAERPARIGTCSLRRQAQLLARFPHWEIIPIRGNVQTRMAKIQELDLDGVILAAAGLVRLGFEDRIAQYIDPTIMIPAIGQGVLGIEIRSQDDRTAELVQVLEDPDTQRCMQAERSLLATLEGGCQVPIGGHAILLSDGNVQLDGIVASTDGTQVVKDRRTGPDPVALGRSMGQYLLDNGGREILQDVYGEQS